MSVFETLKASKDKVKHLLEIGPATRDDDNLLISRYWWKEIGGEKLKTMSAIDLMIVLSEGKLTNPETIRRLRQKIQEQYPHLRGIKFKGKKAEAEIVKQNIHDL